MYKRYKANNLIHTNYALSVASKLLSLTRNVHKLVNQVITWIQLAFLSKKWEKYKKPHGSWNI